MPSVWQWPADQITHVPHGLHTYVHCASITGQPVKAMHSNVQWTSSPSWSPTASLSTPTYKRCVGSGLYACSVFTLHWRMGLYQRHIGMTGIMNSLALYSLTHSTLACVQSFSMHKIKQFHCPCQMHKLIALPALISLTFSPPASACVGEMGRGRYMLGNSCSCSPSKRRPNLLYVAIAI